MRCETDLMHAKANAPIRGSIRGALLAVSDLLLWVSRKSQRKYRGREGDRGRGLIHLSLASEVNPRVGLLVETEDLHGGRFSF
jgi:hypothetical protein